MRQIASLVPVATDSGELSIILGRRDEARSGLSMIKWKKITFMSHAQETGPKMSIHEISVVFGSLCMRKHKQILSSF